MPDFTKYVAVGTTVGSKWDLWASPFSKIGHTKSGSLKVTEFSKSKLAYEGEGFRNHFTELINRVLKKIFPSFDLFKPHPVSFEMTNDGNATICLDNNCISGTYEVQGNALVFKWLFKVSMEARIYQGNGGTETFIDFTCANLFTAYLHVAPAGKSAHEESPFITQAELAALQS